MENKMDMEKRKNLSAEDTYLVEMARKKLRWYTVEASDEEFDEAAVDALVCLIKAMEEKATTKSQVVQEKKNEEQDLEHFRNYCKLYEEDAKLRQNNDDVGKAGKNIRGLRKRLTIVGAAACIVFFCAIGGYVSIANAGEDNGFFLWLKNDGDGRMAVTSPDKLEVKADEWMEYTVIDDVPGEYHQYIISSEVIPQMQNYEFSSLADWNMGTVQRISEKLVRSDTREEIQIGVLIYKEKTIIAQEQYNDYELLYTNDIDGYRQDVFVKKGTAEKKDYFICFYYDNKKYFVEGSGHIDFLENVSEGYMKYIYDNIYKE